VTVVEKKIYKTTQYTKNTKIQKKVERFTIFLLIAQPISRFRNMKLVSYLSVVPISSFHINVGHISI